MIILYSFFLMITPHHAIFLVLTTIYSRKMAPHLASYLLSFFCVFCLFLFVFDSSPAFFFFLPAFYLFLRRGLSAEFTQHLFYLWLRQSSLSWMENLGVGVALCTSISSVPFILLLAHHLSYKNVKIKSQIGDTL